LELVAGGAVASLSNPYWVVWWASIGLSYVMLSLRKGVGGLAAFYLGHSLADFSWNSFLGVLVVSGRRVLSDSVYVGILLVAGCVLIALSTYFIYSGINFLRGKATVPVG
jgi:threonine/homoserine/homoserine lactone efflux protein